MHVGTLQRHLPNYFMEPMPIKVFLVDRQEVVRSGLARAFSESTGFELVGEAESLASGKDAIVNARPDVIVVDFYPNVDSQIEMIGQLRCEHPQLRLLAFSAIDTPEMAQSLMDCGTNGYLVKEASLEEVMAAVRAIAAGRIFFSHTHTTIPSPRRLATGVRENVGNKLISHQYQISDREREVVLMLAEGLTNKEVAKQLFLSIKTVETYRSRVMKKFQLRGRAELFGFAKRLTSVG